MSQVLRLPSGEHVGFAISAHRGKGQLSTVDFGAVPGLFPSALAHLFKEWYGVGVVLVAWRSLALGRERQLG